MKITLPKNLSELNHHLRDPLFKNSLFIMLTSVSSAGFGFIFWMLAAKLYSPQDVGIATALLSSMTLLVLLSRFGLDFSIIRFFPDNDKSRIFSTSALITTSFACLFGVLFIAGVDIFSPELHLLKSPHNAAVFLIALAANSMAGLIAISFVAIRKAGLQFLQNIVGSMKVVLLIPLISLGAIGIFVAVGMSFLLALAVALVLLVRYGVRIRFVIDRAFLSDAFHFSAGNYLASLFMAAPNMILPIMVLNVLGAEQAAYYYVAFAIASLLSTIPAAIGTSLFVEGSYGEALDKAVMKSLIVILSLLIPAAALLYVCGGWVLGVVGAEYAAGGAEVLQVMVVASLFAVVNYVYFAIKRVQKDVKGLVLLGGVIFASLVGFGYLFMLMFGVVGIGYAWVVGNGVGAVVIGIRVWRRGWG